MGKPLHVAGALLIYCLCASIKLVRQLPTLFLPSVPDSKSHVSGGGFHHGMGRDSREITLQNGEFTDIAILRNKAPPVHFSHIAHSLFLVLHTLVSKQKRRLHLEEVRYYIPNTVEPRLSGHLGS